jgi:hypothetical protein
MYCDTDKEGRHLGAANECLHMLSLCAICNCITLLILTLIFASCEM